MPMARPVGGVADAAGPEQWFRSLPLVTQYWFGATMVITIAANFGIINPVHILFDWVYIKDRFQLWRALTCFCFAGAFDFNTLISVYMLVSFSQQYEKGGPFNTGAGGGTADYAFCLIFGALTMLVTSPVVCMVVRVGPMFCRNLVYFVLYVWSKRHPEAQANIWGVPMQAIYLPFAYLALMVFMGNPYFDMLHGIAIGHLYYFLADVVPQVYGKDVLQTPQFLIDQLGVGEYRPEPGANAERRAAQQQAGGGGGGGGHNWGGGGQALGRN